MECKKAYISYAALYTHRRNKHNIIPITNKQDLFKIDDRNNALTFKYSKENDDYGKIALKITEAYENVKETVSTNQASPFYGTKGYDAEFINNFKSKYKTSKDLKIPKPDKAPTIDVLLTIYAIHFVRVADTKYFLSLISKFLFLIRTYLNLIGWDLIKLLNIFEITDNNLSIDCCFTQTANIEFVPDLMEDFATAFIDLDPHFSEFKVQLTDLIKNFCIWLFNNHFTNLKLCLSEEPAE